MPDPVSSHQRPEHAEPLVGAEIAVVFATHNGAHWIERTLEGYARQAAPPRWALVVVDNASTDATPAILARYCEVLPLVVLHEERPGKNVALNRALAAIADLPRDFVFTDDDAVPDPDFLAQWAAVLAERRDHGLFGGTVVPCFEGLDDRIARSYAPFHAEIYALNTRPEGTIAPRHIFGPNMAVSGDLIRAGYRFDETIGPSSADAAYAMGSETEFCIRVAREADAAAWFAGGPRVRHIVRAHQATETFILKRAFRHGRGFAQMEAAVPRDLPARIKLAVRHALLRLAACTGTARAKWNAAWIEGYRAGHGGRIPAKGPDHRP